MEGNQFHSFASQHAHALSLANLEADVRRMAVESHRHERDMQFPVRVRDIDFPPDTLQVREDHQYLIERAQHREAFQRPPELEREISEMNRMRQEQDPGYLIERALYSEACQLPPALHREITEMNRMRREMDAERLASRMEQPELMVRETYEQPEMLALLPEYESAFEQINRTLREESLLPLVAEVDQSEQIAELKARVEELEKQLRNS